MSVDLGGLQTEQRNPATRSIDKVSTLELCQMINREDSKVAAAVEECLPEIAGVIDSLSQRVQQDGRVVYVGAGTSGRLGVLDASELPPTFRANPEQFIALIAGGDDALRHAQEGAEDDVETAVADLKALKLDGLDSLIGIAASGRTPYVLSCLAYARSLGCCTVGVACSYPSTMSKCGHVDHMISAITGPEVVTGSTRLKAGTATKMILNMLSTGTMIKIGKTFGNVMIDVKATNLKLRQRSRNILRTVCGEQCSPTDSELDDLLQQSRGSVKIAAASILLQCPISEAKERLITVNGVLSELARASKPIASEHMDGLHKTDYVLCIDGGGSKCAAVIRDTSGSSWRGEGDPCNAMDVGIDGALSSIEKAVQSAIRICPNLRGKEIGMLHFAEIWIGLAGYDRPSISIPIASALENFFSRPTSSTFRITTDLELLVTAATRQTTTDEFVALIAGTGSSAMMFHRRGDKYVRTGRCGGWGYLLGDDGSGFDIGRQALRHCLAALDLERNGIASSCPDGSKCLLCRRIQQHFTSDQRPNQTYDLLSSVIASNKNHKQESASSAKRRIANVARIVLDIADKDATALAIVDRAVENLVDLVRPLIKSGTQDTSRLLLILAGGLMQNDLFHSKVRSRILDRYQSPAELHAVIRVDDPASAGAEYLLCEKLGEA